jgi:hypothetical protein
MISGRTLISRRPAQPVLAGLAVVFCLTLLVLGVTYVGHFRQVDADGRAGSISASVIDVENVHAPVLMMLQPSLWR